MFIQVHEILVQRSLEAGVGHAIRIAMGSPRDRRVRVSANQGTKAQ